MKFLIILLLTFFANTNIIAQSEIRVRQYAQEYGKELVSKYGTKKASNINTSTKEAEIENNQYVIELETTWDDFEGYLLKDKISCVIRGVLTTNLDGNNKRFNETYRNDAFKKIEAGKNKKETWEPILEDIGKNILEKVFDKLSNYTSTNTNQSNVTKSNYEPLSDLGDFKIIKESEINLGTEEAEGDQFSEIPTKKYVITNSLNTNINYWLGPYADNVKDMVSRFSNNNDAYETKASTSSFKTQFLRLECKSKSGSTIYRNYKIVPEKAYYIQYDENNYPDLYYFFRTVDKTYKLVKQPNIPNNYSYYEVHSYNIDDKAYTINCQPKSKQNIVIIWNYCNYPIDIYVSDCKEDILIENQSSLKKIKPNEFVSVITESKYLFTKTIYQKNGIKNISTPILSSSDSQFCIYTKTDINNNTINSIFHMVRR